MSSSVERDYIHTCLLLQHRAVVNITCMLSALHNVWHTVGAQYTIGRNLRKEKQPTDSRRRAGTEKRNHQESPPQVFGFCWFPGLVPM